MRVRVYFAVRVDTGSCTIKQLVEIPLWGSAALVYLPLHHSAWNGCVVCEAEVDFGVAMGWKVNGNNGRE